ncbi:MAG: hypothetical protein ACR2HG_09705 [Pyrinomonadaceae bacterium]
MIHDRAQTNLAALADFVQTYESARIIVDPPTRTRKTEDTAIKKSNENPT